MTEDYIYGRPLENEEATEEHLWLVVPKKVAFKYVKEPENLEKMRRLIREGKVVNPVFKKGDAVPLRFLRMVKNHMSHFKKFRVYYK